jgi:hypothetical protein
LLFSSFTQCKRARILRKAVGEVKRWIRIVAPRYT